METGVKGYSELMVSEKNTAKSYNSGLLDIFATPAMITLMEQTAYESVQPYLDEGYGTVGISLKVTHDSPTPIGMKVSCESTLVEIDGRKLKFEVEAFDECGSIGKGVHERFIINSEKFQNKANGKLKA